MMAAAQESKFRLYFIPFLCRVGKQRRHSFGNNSSCAVLASPWLALHYRRKVILFCWI